MSFVLAGFVGAMFAAGTYLVLKRNLLKLVWGTLLFSQAANVYLISMGGLPGGAPVLSHSAHGSASSTDPLVQALVLTAIVIGFGTTAFGLVLSLRFYEEHGTMDLREVERRD